MSSIIKLIGLISSLFGWIGNASKKNSIPKTIQKLENDSTFRDNVTIDMIFTIGKIVKNPNYNNIFIQIKENAKTTQTSKFEVKTVVDLNPTSFLIFVLCHDVEVSVTSLTQNTLSKHIRLMYFKVQKYDADQKVDMRSYMYNDMPEKHIMMEFYNEIMKKLA